MASEARPPLIDKGLSISPNTVKAVLERNDMGPD
jgi:hypothetical protein